MAGSIGVVCAAGVVSSVEEIFRIICCMGLALLIVLLFNFVFARYRSRIAKTEVSEILESSMNFYRHSKPEATLEPHGTTQRRIKAKYE